MTTINVQTVWNPVPGQILSVQGADANASNVNGGDVWITVGGAFTPRVTSPGVLKISLGGPASQHSRQSGAIVINDDVGTGLDCAFFGAVDGQPAAYFNIASRAGLGLRSNSGAEWNFITASYFGVEVLDIVIGYRVQVNGVIRLQLNGAARPQITGVRTGTLAQLQAVVAQILSTGAGMKLWDDLTT